jgi:cell division initiation protein
MITPADIEYKEFTKAVRGYKEEEVDDFLDLIIVDMENLINENKKLKSELEHARKQIERQSDNETSVYETLEAAKSLMNDIAASAERRAEVLLKNAELEASLITKEARESISKLNDEGNRLRARVETLRTRYKKLLEDELERVKYSTHDLFEDFDAEFDIDFTKTQPKIQYQADDDMIVVEPVKHDKEQDLSKTIVNIR